MWTHSCRGADGNRDHGGAGAALAAPVFQSGSRFPFQARFLAADTFPGQRPFQAAHTGTRTHMCTDAQTDTRTPSDTQMTTGSAPDDICVWGQHLSLQHGLPQPCRGCCWWQPPLWPGTALPGALECCKEGLPPSPEPPAHLPPSLCPLCVTRPVQPTAQPPGPGKSPHATEHQVQVQCREPQRGWGGWRGRLGPGCSSPREPLAARQTVLTKC